MTKNYIFVFLYCKYTKSDYACELYMPFEVEFVASLISCKYVVGCDYEVIRGRLKHVPLHGACAQKPPQNVRFSHTNLNYRILEILVFQTESRSSHVPPFQANPTFSTNSFIAACLASVTLISNWRGGQK